MLKHIALRGWVKNETWLPTDCRSGSENRSKNWSSHCLGHECNSESCFENNLDPEGCSWEFLSSGCLGVVPRLLKELSICSGGTFTQRGRQRKSQWHRTEAHLMRSEKLQKGMKLALNWKITKISLPFLNGKSPDKSAESFTKCFTREGRVTITTVALSDVSMDHVDWVPGCCHRLETGEGRKEATLILDATGHWVVRHKFRVNVLLTNQRGFVVMSWLGQRWLPRAPLWSTVREMGTPWGAQITSEEINNGWAQSFSKLCSISLWDIPDQTWGVPAVVSPLSLQKDMCSFCSPRCGHRVGASLALPQKIDKPMLEGPWACVREERPPA